MKLDPVERKIKARIEEDFLSDSTFDSDCHDRVMEAISAAMSQPPAHTRSQQTNHSTGASRRGYVSFGYGAAVIFVAVALSAGYVSIFHRSDQTPALSINQTQSASDQNGPGNNQLTEQTSGRIAPAHSDFSTTDGMSPVSSIEVIDSCLVHAGQFDDVFEWTDMRHSTKHGVQAINSTGDVLNSVFHQAALQLNQLDTTLVSDTHATDRRETPEGERQGSGLRRNNMSAAGTVVSMLAMGAFGQRFEDQWE